MNFGSGIANCRRRATEGARFQISIVDGMGDEIVLVRTVA